MYSSTPGPSGGCDVASSVAAPSRAASILESAVGPKDTL